ncbi:transcription elongation factor GreA [Patescibacteria group bacterium]|nr:transcription elongation factor GreA [Patescibacteria group bacterium]MBU1890915.1 transcription elongation factor GreA [Patescibacteria group bacterium]
MTDKTEYITKEGYDKLIKELDMLKNVKRKEIANRIQEAKELGDLSENAEYAEAKNEQSFTEGRIIQLDNLLKNVTLIEDKTKSKTVCDIVEVGSKIKLESDGSITEYTIVGSNEADPDKGFISNESPLGDAFLGRKLNDAVEIDVPAGKVTYVITHIE